MDAVLRTQGPPDSNGRRSTLAVLGGLAGLALAYAAARGFDSLLAGVQPNDPWTYAGAAFVTVLVTLSGSLIPAMRALRVDPVSARRAE